MFLKPDKPDDKDSTITYAEMVQELKKMKVDIAKETNEFIKSNRKEKYIVRHVTEYYVRQRTNVFAVKL